MSVTLRGGGAGQDKYHEQNCPETLCISAALCSFQVPPQICTPEVFFVARLRLICCPFLSLCDGFQELPEATSAPCGVCKGKMERYGTRFSSR